MSVVSCKICFKAYSEQVPPRILHCGHSCCSTCLTKILETSKLCPMCRKTLTFSNINQYVVNYSLLEVCEEFATSSCIQNLKKRLESVKDKHKRILTAASLSVSNILTNQYKVTLMKSNETKLIELMESNFNEINVKEANATLEDVEYLMNDVAKIFCYEDNHDYKIQFNMNQFNTPREYLLKVYNEIRNGKEVAARSTINGEEKFAMVSIQESSMFIHAFNSTTNYENAIFVEFEDMKNAFLGDQMRVFFDFISVTTGLQKRIFIECFSKSIFIIFFLKLCTGETGISYVDCSLEETGVTKRRVICSQLEIKEKDKYLEYLARRQIDCFDCQKDKTYISFLTNGSFEIFQSDRNVINVIGRVISRTAINNIFSDTGFNSVFDCGISYTL